MFKTGSCHFQFFLGGPIFSVFKNCIFWAFFLKYPPNTPLFKNCYFIFFCRPTDEKKNLPQVLSCCEYQSHSVEFSENFEKSPKN